MSRSFIFAEPSQNEGVNFPKEVLLGVLQDSLILKAALEAVHAAVQTESNNQKVLVVAAIASARKKNPSLELDDWAPIAVEVFKCPELKQRRMLQILGDLHRPGRLEVILSQLRQLFGVRPQKERITSLSASCYRDRSEWIPTATTTAAADCSGPPDAGRSTLPSSPNDFGCNRLMKVAESYVKEVFGPEVAKPASRELDKGTAKSNPFYSHDPSAAAAEALGVPDDKCLANERAGPTQSEMTKLWVEYVCAYMDTVCATRDDLMKSNPLLTDAHTREALGRHCHDAWFREEMEKGFERIRDKDAAGWEFLEEIGLEFDSHTRNIIRNSLRRDSETVEVDINMCTRWRYNEAARKLAARNWAEKEASGFAKQICDKIDRISVEVGSPGNRREPSFPEENTISKESRHCGKLLDLLEKYSKARLSEPQILRDLMVKNVEYVIRELFNAESPGSNEPSRQIQTRSEVNSLSQEAPQDEWTASKMSTNEIKDDSLNYSKEVLERSIHFGEGLDRSHTVAAASFKSRTAETDATDRTNGGRSTTPAPKHHGLIRWICLNLSGTRTQKELRSVHTDNANSFCRDAWLCAALEERLDRVRDGKVDWNEFEEIGFSFTDQAKKVILKYLKEGSPDAFHVRKDVHKFCDSNPELWKSAAREWALERANALAKKLYSKIQRVHGRILSDHETGFPSLILRWENLLENEPKHGLAIVARRCVSNIIQRMVSSKSELYCRHLTDGKPSGLPDENCDYKAFQKFLREHIGIVLPDSDDFDKAFRDVLGIDRVSPSPRHEFDYNVDTERLIELAEDCIQRIFGLRGAKHAPREFDKATESHGVPDDETLTTAADPSKAVEANLRLQRTSSQRPSFYNNQSDSSRTAAADSTGLPDDGRWTPPQPIVASNHRSLIKWICTHLTRTKTLEKLFSWNKFRPGDCRDAWLCAELEERFTRFQDGKAEWKEFEDIGFSFTDQGKTVILKYLKGDSPDAFQGGKNVAKLCDFNSELWKLAAHEWAVEKARYLADKLAGEVKEVVMSLTKTENPALRVKLTYLPSNEPMHVGLIKFFRKRFNGLINWRCKRYWLALACEEVEELDGQKAKAFEDFRKSVQMFSGIVIPQSGVCCRDNLEDSLSIRNRFKCKVDKDRLIKLADAFLKEQFGPEGAEEPDSRQLDEETAIPNPSYYNSPSAAAEPLGVPDVKCLTNERAGPTQSEITKLWVEYVCENMDMDTVFITRDGPMKSNTLLKDAHTREALDRHCYDAWWRGEIEKGFERIRDKDAAGWEFLEEIGLEFDSHTRNMIRNSLRRDSETVEVDMNMCTRWRYNETARKLAARNWAKKEASGFAKQICDKIDRISVEVDSPGNRREPSFPEENRISKESRHCGKLLDLLEKYSKARLSEPQISRELMVMKVEYVIRELFNAESPDSNEPSRHTRTESEV